MPRYRRGWGRSYGAGEHLPDPDPTPPEDDEDDEVDEADEDDPIGELLRELGRASDQLLGVPDPAAFERLRQQLRERTRRG